MNNNATSGLRAELDHIYLIASFAIVVYSWLAFSIDVNSSWGPGWDFMTTCDASYALMRGQDPYSGDSYEFSKNLYTYSPLSLRLFSPLCRLARIADVHRVYSYFPLYWMVLVFSFLAAMRIGRFGAKAGLAFFVLISAYAGTLWVVRTGNVTILEMTALFVAMAFLYRIFTTDRDSVATWGYGFAVFFGLFCSVKTIYVAFIPLMLVLPARKRLLLAWMVVAAVIGLLPEVVSYIRHPDLVLHQLANIANDQKLCNPSLICLYRDVGHNNIKSWIAASAVSLSLGVVAYALFKSVISYVPAWLSERHKHDPQFQTNSVKVFILLLMLATALLPRLKEYSFCIDAVLLAYYLLLRARTDLRLFVLIAVSILPTLASHLMRSSDNVFGYFIQLTSLWVTLAIIALEVQQSLSGADIRQDARSDKGLHNRRMAEGGRAMTST